MFCYTFYPNNEFPPPNHIGKIATTQTRIVVIGLINVEGDTYEAVSPYKCIEENQKVRITGIHMSQFIVVPLPPDPIRNEKENLPQPPQSDKFHQRLSIEWD